MGGSLTLTLSITFVLGYALGSIPFGLVLTRWAGLGDIRTVGSGNIGATNVLRTGNKGLAVATLALDLLKGTAAVFLALEVFPFIAGIAAPEYSRILLVHASMWSGGLGALAGHVYPVWLGFKGGKGVATYLGVLLGAHWPAAVIFALVWFASAGVFRISSLAALVALGAVLVYFVVNSGGITLAAVVLMTALVAWKHAANIGRLMKGEEPKIGVKA